MSHLVSILQHCKHRTCQLIQRHNKCHTWYSSCGTSNAEPASSPDNIAKAAHASISGNTANIAQEIYLAARLMPCLTATGIKPYFKCATSMPCPRHTCYTLLRVRTGYALPQACTRYALPQAHNQYVLPQART